MTNLPREGLVKIADPVAWRWRHKGAIHWEYGAEKPNGPSIDLFDVEPLYNFDALAKLAELVDIEDDAPTSKPN